jgi:hypothetical protein
MISEGEIALRIAVAVVLGAIVGVERELTPGGRLADPHDHRLGVGRLRNRVGLQLRGVHRSHERYELSGRRHQDRLEHRHRRRLPRRWGDPEARASVRGLTTGASIWVAAAVGLAAGLGSFYVAVLSTVVLVILLTVLRGPRRWLQKAAIVKEAVIIRLRPGSNAGAVVMPCTPSRSSRSALCPSEGPRPPRMAGAGTSLSMPTSKDPSWKPGWPSWRSARK